MTFNSNHSMLNHHIKYYNIIADYNISRNSISLLLEPRKEYLLQGLRVNKKSNYTFFFRLEVRSNISSNMSTFHETKQLYTDSITIYLCISINLLLNNIYHRVRERKGCTNTHHRYPSASDP